MPRLKAVYPISGEDTTALPVKDLEEAISFYETKLGFRALSRDASSATIARDDVRLGLILSAQHEPGKAGSIAFLVDELEALHRELHAKGADPGKFGIGEWSGRQHRTFFTREADNGYCFCFFCPSLESGA